VFHMFQTIDWMVQEEKNLFAPHYAGYLGSNLDEAKKLLEKVLKFAPTCKVRTRSHETFYRSLVVVVVVVVK